MFEMNQSDVAEILLLGFQNPQIFNSLLFLLFLVIYILTLVGNLLIIILVEKFMNLKPPMYFFLAQLSVCDLLLTTNISPNMLHVIINGGGTISLTGCIAQFYFLCLSEATECFLLTVMSYDRYLAICHPLRYTSIMSFRFCFQLVLLSWFLSCILTLIFAPLVSALQFCGHVIDHYFCDLTPLVELSCIKHSIVKLVEPFLITIQISFVIMQVSLVIFTYVSILITILGISSSIGRQKAFSTCSAHLIVVSAYYGTLTIVYLTPSKGHSVNINKSLSVLYTVLCPFCNPIIYSFRNKNITMLLNKFTSKILTII